jgi:hypothetical protein
MKPVEDAHRRLTRFEDSAASAAATKLETAGAAEPFGMPAHLL